MFDEDNNNLYNCQAERNPLISQTSYLTSYRTLQYLGAILAEDYRAAGDLPLFNAMANMANAACQIAELITQGIDEPEALQRTNYYAVKDRFLAVVSIANSNNDEKGI